MTNACQEEKEGNSAAPLTRAFDGDLVELLASGSWTALHAAELSRAVTDSSCDATPRSRANINLAGVRELDTFGAWLLERLRRRVEKAGGDAHLTRVPERYTRLLANMHHVNRDADIAPGGRTRLSDHFEALGRLAASLANELVGLVVMLGAIGEAAARVLRHPTRFRLTSAVHHLDRVAWQAIPIILMITFLIGCIIAQQGIFHFRKFGAEDYVVDLVGILILREIGILLVAIMVAGRSGSSYTAEIGSMKQREEIDALRTMGLDPVEILILPRVFALLLAMPMLAFIGALAALYGGGLIAWIYGGMSPAIYIARLHDAVSITHFEVGMIKAPFMALVIGAVACSEGLKVRGSAESLGLATTSSVVKSIFLMIVLDGVFAIFFASIGM
jgi:phospholipid/cholesterol/gamma-HCH transport system permease protein